MYTNKSIRLHSRCLGYLELIQKANNRVSEQATNLHHYDNEKNAWKAIRLFHTRIEFEDKLSRYQELAEWLVNRYQAVMNDLVTETLKRIPAPLSIAS